MPCATRQTWKPKRCSAASGSVLGLAVRRRRILRRKASPLTLGFSLGRALVQFPQLLVLTRARGAVALRALLAVIRTERHVDLPLAATPPFRAPPRRRRPGRPSG